MRFDGAQVASGWRLARRSFSFARCGLVWRPVPNERRLTVLQHPVVSRDEWLIKRCELLTREKEAIHLRDAINAER